MSREYDGVELACDNVTRTDILAMSAETEQKDAPDSGDTFRYKSNASRSP